MAIEGIGNLYGVPAVKKEHEPGMNQKKKQKRDRKKRAKKEEGQQKTGKGKVDIRI